MSQIRGILFDSAEVLVYPTVRPGAEPPWRRWFPGPRFEELVRSEHPDLPSGDIDPALDAGMAFLDSLDRCDTSEEEIEIWIGFFQVVLASLGAGHSSDELLRSLAEARVFGDQMRPFDDITDGLPRLRGHGLRLGVLSEAWPSLGWHYAQMGLREHFDAFVVSAAEGRLKDDPELFVIAAARLRLDLAEILFVDDHPPHVRTAIATGMKAAVMARGNVPGGITDLDMVRDLAGVECLARENSVSTSGA